MCWPLSQSFSTLSFGVSVGKVCSHKDTINEGWQAAGKLREHLWMIVDLFQGVPTLWFYIGWLSM
ncbi:hypothetical protein ACE6H2_015304 [Prunus campanulata]